jgi:hypothetical protein
VRFVKLSKEDSSFASLDDVRHFFFHEIPHRTPPGKFRVTPRRISPERLHSGEPLVFTYQGRVVFTAKARSGLLPNEDEEYRKYPRYFVVDLTTLCEANEDLSQVQEQLEAIGLSGSLFSEGWNIFPDSVETQHVWQQLRGAENLTMPD